MESKTKSTKEIIQQSIELVGIMGGYNELPNEMKNLHEMNKCINALDTKAARYIDCDGVTDLEYLMDCIDSLEYHKEDLDSAIEEIKKRIEELNK